MKLKKFFILIFKKNLLTTIFTLFLILLVIYSKTNMFAAQTGLALWAKSVVPSLLPFFIATELLNYTNLTYYLGKLTNRFMKPLFNVPGEGSYAFIMGIISGYPVGAKIINKFIEEKICTTQEAERMLAFTNNSGPLFIIGTVGISLYGDTTIGIILFVTHILACLTVGIIFGFVSKRIPSASRVLSNSSDYSNYGTDFSTYKTDYPTHRKNYSTYRSNHKHNYTNNSNSTNKYNSYSNYNSRPIKHSIWKKIYSTYRGDSDISYDISDLGTILSVSITNAISTIMLIGGFIVLFSIIISILNNLNVIDNICGIFEYIHIPADYTRCILTGLLELTNGVNAVSAIHTKKMSVQIIITAFLLGFAGLSIFLQVFSIASKHNLSMKPYLIGKLLQGIIAAFYTFLILWVLNSLYFDIVNL